MDFSNIRTATNRVVNASSKFPAGQSVGQSVGLGSNVNIGNTVSNTTPNTVSNTGISRGLGQNTPNIASNNADPNQAKAMAYLKEYVGQMRAAGFPDFNIRKKLEKIGSINIPDNLPANFGQTGAWTQGMADEFRMAAMNGGTKTNTPQALEDWVPSPDEYLNYMPGNTANRLPSYSEYMGQGATGKFSQAKLENLRKKLQDNIAGYKGSKIGSSESSMEAGIAGLPQDIGQKYFQEFLTLADQKANDAKKQTDYESLVMQNPEVQFTPGATVEENAAKIRQYNETIVAQKQSQQAPDLPTVSQTLNNAVYQAVTNGETINMDDVMNASLMMGIKLSYDEAMAIFNSAKQQAMRDKGQ